MIGHIMTRTGFLFLNGKANLLAVYVKVTWRFQIVIITIMIMDKESTSNQWQINQQPMANQPANMALPVASYLVFEVDVW